jgi:hypothetical protein
MTTERPPRKGPRDSKGPKTGGWVDPTSEFTPAELHAAYVRQRLEGGEPATAAAYADALAQWRGIPGAVQASAADCGEVPPAPEADSPERPV